MPATGPPRKWIVTRKGRDSGTEARGASASRAQSTHRRGFSPGQSLTFAPFPGCCSTATEPKDIDQSRERGRLLAPTGVVEEESGEWLAPVVQHAHQYFRREKGRRLLLRQEGQTHAINRSTDQNLDIVDDQRSSHCDGQGLLAFVEFPPVQASRSV